MYYKLETKLGNVWLHPTQADHIYVDFGHNLNVAEESATGRHGPLTIRGVVYSGSIHMYLWSDGSWHVGPENAKSDYDRRQSLYMSRYDARTYTGSFPTPAARKSVEEIVPPLVNEWAKANPEALKDAEIEHVSAEYERARETWHEALQASKKAEQAVLDLGARLAELMTE